MSANRDGAYVRPRGSDVRSAVQINVLDNKVSVEGEEHRALGFTRGEAQGNAQDFVSVLSDLSNKIIEEQNKLDPWAGDLNEQLDRTLALDAGASEKYLSRLAEAGRLRSKLSADVQRDLEYTDFNFLKRENGAGKRVMAEPPLAFFEHVKDANTAPVLWEMMYEGKLADDHTRWNQFWGFRVPITYWGSRFRRVRIDLDNGIFAAAYDGLPYAGKELSELTERIGAAHKFESLADVLRRRVREALGAGADSELKGDWLADFFKQQQNQFDESAIKRWKRKVWVNVFMERQDAYGLIHFACHCTPGANSEFLSRLDLKVGGEELCLDAGFISSDLSRAAFRKDDPGPLVFLNACGSGQATAGHRPPGFPITWMQNQGALAVLVTLCPVPDYFAHRFASKFYEILSKALARPETCAGRRNRYVAMALLLTRRYFMKRYANPLGLAYVLYGMKDVYVEAGAAGHGGAA
jgi:hypothetical protein